MIKILTITVYIFRQNKTCKLNSALIKTAHTMNSEPVASKSISSNTVPITINISETKHAM